MGSQVMQQGLVLIEDVHSVLRGYILVAAEFQATNAGVILEVTTGRVSQIKKSAISSLRHFLGEREALILKE